MKATTLQYAKTLLELTDGKSEQEISSIVEKFAKQLQKDGQLKNAKSIMEKFSELFNSSHGIVQAQAITSKKLENTKEVEQFIAKNFSAEKVEVEYVVDETIKGGIIIKVGDEIIDGSVATNLKRLKNILVK